MAGQVDVIVSKKAIAEIEKATQELNKLHNKILQINKAGANAKVGGVDNNQAIIKEIQSINKLITANNKLTSANGKRISAMRNSTKATKSSTSANKKSLVVIRALSTAMRSFGLALGGAGILAFGKKIFSLAKTFDSLRFAMEKTSRTLETAQMNMRFMLETSKELGLDLVSTTTRFIKFSAAARNSGLVMKDTQKIFLTMAKAGAVLGLRTDELSGVFLALEQMLSKGKVTTEELRRQLGERLPGAFGIMAASLGVTLPQLDELLKKGKLISSEVLPGFADAVEVAFGLDTVDKIETLVASENRLSTAWQNYVKNLTGSDSVISKFFKGVLDYITEAVEASNMLFNKDEAMEQLQTRNSFTQTKNEIEDYAKFRIDSVRKTGNKIEDINKEFDAAKRLREKATTKEEIATADEATRKANLKQLKFRDEVNEFATKDAQKSFGKALENKRLAEEAVKEAKKELETIQANNDKMSWSKKLTSFKPTGDIEIKIEGLIEKLNKAQGKLNATRLLAEESADPIGGGGDDGGSSLRNIRDLEIKIKAERLLAEVEFNKKMIESNTKTYAERVDLAEDNAENLKKVSNLRFVDEVDWNNKKAKLEKEKTTSDKQRQDIDKENQQKNELLLLDHNKRVRKIEIDHEKFLDKELDKDLKRKLDKTQAGFDKKEKALEDSFRKEFKDMDEAQKKAFMLDKDYAILKKNLDKDITKNASDANDERIKILVAYNQALLLTLGISTEEVERIRNEIARLQSGLSTGASKPGSEDDPDKKREQYETDLEWAGKFASELANIGNAVFERKIAKIDAEIEAEEEKYNLLFALAEGDAEQKRLLAIQEEEDKQKLEKKKRKVQREQAIFNKANALIEIAINTAISASKTLATTGLVFGLPLLPVVYSLGALQAAAVLAQPLPQFAEGGVMDHDGLAVVGDGGKREVIRTPDGEISITPDTDTLVNLPKGTEIFSSIEKFNNNNPSDLTGMLHSATLLASISLNQKNIEGLLTTQRELDERLLDEMIRNTKAVKNSKSNTFVKTEKVDIPHSIWKSKLIN